MQKTEENMSWNCVICGVDISGKYTGFVRFVNGKPVCNDCYISLKNGRNMNGDKDESNESNDIV